MSPSTSNVKLIGYAPSRVMRTIWMLTELGIPYEHDPIAANAPELKQPPYTDWNPNGRVPIVIVDGFAIWESLAINLYLDRKFPSAISLTTLDDELKRTLEPRAAAPSARLRAIRVLSEHRIPVGVLCSPMIPMINDMELESLLEAARDNGARQANYMLLRLPREVGPLFEEWLQAHYPQRAAHVMSIIRQCRGGEIYDSRFGHRFKGQGPFAELLAQRFAVAIRKLGLNRRRDHALDCSRFCPPGGQMALL